MKVNVNSDDFLLDSSGTDEYWDYPGDDDPWLASLEPEVFDDGGTPGDPTDDIFYWRHITDLYGPNFGLPAGTFYDPSDRNAPWQWNGSSSLYYVDNNNDYT